MIQDIGKLALPLMLTATSFISTAHGSQLALDNETEEFVHKIASQIPQVNDGYLFASMIVTPDQLTWVTNGGMTIGHSIFFLAGYDEQRKPYFWAADFNGGKQFWNIGSIHTGYIRTLDDKVDKSLTSDLESLKGQWRYTHNSQWVIPRSLANDIQKEILDEQKSPPLFNLVCTPRPYVVWHPTPFFHIPVPELRWETSYNCCSWAIKYLWKCGLNVPMPVFIPEGARITNQG